VSAKDEDMATTDQLHASPDSVMRLRGVGRERQPVTHQLREGQQGTYHYTIGPYSNAVLTIFPGDRVVVDTKDAFDGAISSEEDKPSEKIRLPFTNPQNGPILVDRAEMGDALAVLIESIEPRGPQPRGTCCLIPNFGALTGTHQTAILNEPLPEIVRKVNVDEKWVYWSERTKFPYRPHIGTLSCSPEIDSINTLTPDTHGGNMDLPDVAPGSIAYLPVRVPGARLFLGDAHACQGDGEVCGVAVEHATTTTIRVDVVKKWPIQWPRLETADFIMTIGSARPLEDACRIAYRELVAWMVESHGFTKWDAYMILSQCGRLRVGNLVDPKYTVGAFINRTYLE
jgi:amidase